MKRAHRKLQINVEDIEKQYEHEANSNEEEITQEENIQQDYEQSVQHQQYSQEEEQQDNSEAVDSDNQVQQVEESSVQIRESIETFGNNNYCQNILKSMHVNPQLGLNKSKQAKLIYLLPETPIEVSNSPNINFQSEKRIDQSNLEDEVDRIINKVMKKEKEQSNRPFKVENYKKELDKARKIEKINKDLLHQNAQLIGKINQLEKKVNDLNTKMLNHSKAEKKKDRSISCFDDKQLLKTLKLYRQKMAKAIQLNSKLTSRINTEKSKSQLLSQVQKSILNQGQVERQIGGISTIRSQSIREDMKNQKSKPLNITERFKEQEAYCNCCKLLKKGSVVEAEKKQASSHPILQMVNDYKVSGSAAKFLQTQTKSPQKIRKSSYCQVNFDEQSFIQQFQGLQSKQRELQRIVDQNNYKIQQYQNRLLKMIEME